MTGSCAATSCGEIRAIEYPRPVHLSPPVPGLQRETGQPKWDATRSRHGTMSIADWSAIEWRRLAFGTQTVHYGLSQAARRSRRGGEGPNRAAFVTRSAA